MSIAVAFQDLLKLRTLSIPMSAVSLDTVEESFGPRIQEKSDEWHVPCSHYCNPGARSAEIKAASDALPWSVPDALAELLQICNGSSLFVVPKVGLEKKSGSSD
jgi:hypothetical protein